MLTAAQRACGSDGSRECVVEAGLGKGTLVLFVCGGEGLELSRIQALAASHGRTSGCFRQARVSTMAPIFRHATTIFGLLLKEKRKGRFSSG